MKKIIIIGVCLVTGAIVYGFVDYLKTDKKQLQRMYGDEIVPATPEKAPAVAVAQPETMSAMNSLLLKSPPPKLVHKKLNLKLYSRAALEEKYIAPDTTALTVMPVMKKQDAPTVEARYVKQPKKTVEEPIFKKVSFSSFSRGSLRKRPVVVDTAVAATTAVPAN